jgi:hypothetical protein
MKNVILGLTRGETEAALRNDVSKLVGQFGQGIIQASEIAPLRAQDRLL